MVIPIFSSHYSFNGRSILTVEDSDKELEEINENRPVSIFDIAIKHNLKDIFLADYSLSGLIDAVKAAEKLSLNLRFGYKVICCEDIDDKSENSFNSEHKIIIWINNPAGYSNFIQLISKAQTDGFYYIPRIDYKTLREFWSDSLSITIPFYDSFLHKNTLLNGKCIPNFPCNPILFLESNDLPFDYILEDKVKSFAANQNLEIVETKSVYYYSYNDYEYYLINKCINERSSLEKPELRFNSSNTFCFEDALNKGISYDKNSKWEQSFRHLDLPFHGIRLPHIEIDEKIKKSIGVDIECDNYTLLKALCKNGFLKRRAAGQIKDNEVEWYRNQVQHELKTLRTLGFVDYILIVWDMVNFCRENKIPVGRGRGSAAGSSVLYLLGVTDIPIKRHGLLFERFLSADRAEIKIKDGIEYLQDSPDVDQDISRSQRYKVIDYLNQKYPGQTSKIINISTLQGKVLVKEVAKCVDNCEQSDLNLITNLIPVEFGNVADIERVYNEEPLFKEWCDKYPKSYKAALKLRGLAKNKSVHASGYLVTHCPINEFIPTELTSDKQLVSSFDMYSAGTIAVKLDLLGLKTLDILDEAGRLSGKDFNLIDIDDSSIYKYLSNNNAPFMGIFQAEEGLGEKTMRRIAPDKVEHIIDSLAIGRPGAFRYTDDYCDFKRGVKFPNINPKVQDILEPTGGLLLYQETLMALSVRMANFTPNESNGIRKAVGKKDKKKMLSYKERFLDGALKNNYTKEYAEDIWQTFENSADYSFNRSHSASYGYLTATTAYFKANHPKEFFISLLKNAKNESEPLVEVNKIQKELKYFGIKLLPPSLLKGNIDFEIEGNNIRFGLNSIKGLAESSLEKLNNFKPENCSKFEMFQAGKQAGLSCGVMAALIMSGALDEFVSETRSKLSFECLLFSKLKDKEKLYCINQAKKGQTDLLELVKCILDWTDSLGKKISRKTRLNTLRKDTAKYQEIYKNNSSNEILCNYWYENSLLGYSYSSSLKDIFCESSNRDDLISLEEFKNLDGLQSGIIVCQVKEFKVGKSKKGNDTMKLFVSDETDLTYFYFSGSSYKEYLIEHNNKPDIEIDDIVAIKVQKSKDSSTGFIQKLKKQKCKIFTKLADIKEIEYTENLTDELNTNQKELNL